MKKLFNELSNYIGESEYLQVNLYGIYLSIKFTKIPNNHKVFIPEGETLFGAIILLNRELRKLKRGIWQNHVPDELELPHTKAPLFTAKPRRNKLNNLEIDLELD